MFFTQEDYRKIENYLKGKSIKDTAFTTSSSLTGEEVVAFIQDGKNVKMKLKDLLASFRTSNFINVMELGEKESYTLEEALDVVPKEARSIGCIITFIDTETEDWRLYQFLGDNINNWYDTEYWRDILEKMDNHFKGAFENEDLLYASVPTPEIGDYAFVGLTLGESVIYRCRNRWVWSPTTENAFDYIKVVVEGNITVGSNGNWFQDGVDTGIKAQGPKGDGFTFEDLTEAEIQKLQQPAQEAAIDAANEVDKLKKDVSDTLQSANDTIDNAVNDAEININQFISEGNTKLSDIENKASEAVSNTNTAIENTNTAIENANQATANTNAAIATANQAAENANQAADKALNDGLFKIQQSLTEEEQAQVKQNIGVTDLIVSLETLSINEFSETVSATSSTKFVDNIIPKDVEFAIIDLGSTDGSELPTTPTMSVILAKANDDGRVKMQGYLKTSHEEYNIQIIYGPTEKYGLTVAITTDIETTYKVFQIRYLSSLDNTVFKGSYGEVSQLISAYPTAKKGNYAYVGNPRHLYEWETTWIDKGEFNYNVDLALDSESKRAIANKTVFNRFNKLEEDVANILGKKIGEKKSGLLNTEGEIEVNKSWSYIDYVDIKPGDYLFIYIQTAPSSPYSPIVIYDSNKTFLRTITINYNGLYKSTDEGFVRICGKSTDDLFIIKINDINEVINSLFDLSADYGNFKDTILGSYVSQSIEFSFHGYINETGSYVSNENQRTTDFLNFNVIEYSVQSILQVLGCSYINFYDENKSWLKDLSSKYVADGTFDKKILIKPLEAKYVRITSNRDYVSYYSKAREGGIVNDIFTLNEKVATNTEKINENSSEIEKIKENSNSDIVKIDIPFDFQGYINATGQFITHPNGKTTDFLSYDKINFTLTYELSALNCSYINFYNEKFEWLQELSAVYKKDETVSNKELIRPKGATYYRLTASPSREHSAYFLSENYKKRKTINRNINWVGHSIWWYDGNKLGGDGEVARGYQTLLKEQFNLTQVGNYCYSGHSLGGLTTEDENSILEPATISTWKSSENAVWTLDTITNDFKRNIPIGTIEDYNNNTGITTYYGALRVFKDKIIELSGEDAIIICSNALRRNNSGYTSTSENTEGHTLEDYELALMTVASKNKWMFVDQFRLSGITDNSIMVTTIDGLHLNNFGYTLAVIPWVLAFDTLYNKDLLDFIVQPNFPV